VSAYLGRYRGETRCIPSPTCRPRRTRPGWRCSTRPRRGWRAAVARWPRGATPATGEAASRRSSTGCSPTRPVPVPAFAGNTADRTAFVAAVDTVRTTFGLTDLVLVGDRGMITSARIEALRQLGGMGWLTCLRAPAIAKLAADEGPLQTSLFDTQDLAE